MTPRDRQGGCPDTLWLPSYWYVPQVVVVGLGLGTMEAADGVEEVVP